MAKVEHMAVWPDDHVTDVAAEVIGVAEAAWGNLRSPQFVFCFHSWGLTLQKGVCVRAQSFIKLNPFY